MNIQELFKEQIAQTTREDAYFFYGLESGDKVRLVTHKTGLDNFPENLQFTRMVGSTPFFVDMRELKSELGYSRVGLGNV